MIRNIKTGIRYEAKQDDFEQSYGWIDVQIGTVSDIPTGYEKFDKLSFFFLFQLNMDLQHLEDNFRTLLADIRTKGPIRTKDDEDYRFMTR